MDRRRFLRALMGSGVLAAPLAAAAQQPGRVYRVGILASYPVEASPPIAVPLRDLGYVEGRNILFEIRSANDLPERLPALAAELVRLKVDVIVTGGDREVAVAKQATTTIPIVMAPSGDPVGAGFVASLARPGGNITGVSFMSPDLSAKQLEVLRDAVPNLSRIAVLWNASNPVKVIDFDQTRRAALALRLKVSSIEVRALGDLETAFAAITRVSPDALLILIDQVLSHVSRPRIAQFAIQRRIPSIAGNSNYAAAGGLIGYGPTSVELNQVVATQVARILEGANPAELPIAQPSRLELSLNLKTAKALGLTIPQTLLQRADQVIE